MINKLQEYINSIKPANKKAMDKASEYMDSLAKPLGSLGKLEDISIKLAGISGKVQNNINKSVLLVFASDNGVCVHNVSSTPQIVTLEQSINLTKGLTGGAVLANAFGMDLKVIDVGVKEDTSLYNIKQAKIRKSTSDFYMGNAMSKEECIKAILVGIETVLENKDYDLFGVGEMGIGNTSTSSAILSVLLDLKVEEVTGKGAGLSYEGYLNKINVIKHGIEINKPNKSGVIDVLSKVGGFDICAMTGAYLGAAILKKPVIIDGFISATAALCAYKLNSFVKDYMFASHQSYEKGYLKCVEEIGLSPLFDLKMRLGEGSGCPIALEIIKAACAITNNMATFQKANINDDYLKDLDKKESF